jgi:hypothetical protein
MAFQLDQIRVEMQRTSMDDSVRIVEVGQAGHDGHGNLAKDWLLYRAVLLVDVVEGPVWCQQALSLAAAPTICPSSPCTLIGAHQPAVEQDTELTADMRIRQIRSVEGHDVLGALQARLSPRRGQESKNERNRA